MPETYRRDCVLGAVGALFMLVGDLCLSVVPVSVGDSGLYTREAYLSGSYEKWRLALLLVTGIIGMSLAYFTVRAMYFQIKPQYKKTKKAVLAGGIVYVSSAAALHFFIGTLADWVSRLSPVLGRENALSLVTDYYDTVMPATYIICGNVFAHPRRRLRASHGKNVSAEIYDGVPPHRVADRVRSDTGSASAVGSGGVNVGFRAQPMFGQRGAFHLDDCERGVGGENDKRMSGIEPRGKETPSDLRA